MYTNILILKLFLAFYKKYWMFIMEKKVKYNMHMFYAKENKSYLGFID